MKYFKTRQTYENSTGTNIISLHYMRATSYSWWPYLRRINGLVVFNNGHYSPTTDRHQRQCLDLLDRHGIEIDLMVYTTTHLDNIPRVIDEIKEDIKAIDKAIDNPKSNNVKNIDRLREIERLTETVEILERITGEEAA